jgi:hypothetical protein
MLMTAARMSEQKPSCGGGQLVIGAAHVRIARGSGALSGSCYLHRMYRMLGGGPPTADCRLPTRIELVFFACYAFLYLQTLAWIR